MESPAPTYATVMRRQPKVERVVVTNLPEVDLDYTRVEFVIEGHLFVMDGPNAQTIGQMLAMAGGWSPPYG